MAFPLTGAVEILDWLDRVVTKLANSDDADLNRAAEAIRLMRHGAPFAQAVGLSDGWKRHTATRRQQAALAALAAVLLPMPSYRTLADEMASMMARYEASRWRHDTAAGCRPIGQEGLLFDLLVTACPRSASRLRRLLPGLIELKT